MMQNNTIAARIEEQNSPYFSEGVALGPGPLLVLANICNKDLCAKNCSIFPAKEAGRDGEGRCCGL
jgi:hypothetical protein